MWRLTVFNFRSYPLMADSILFNIFTPCFLVFLILLGKESDCHSSADIFNYPAEDPIGDFLLCRQCGADLADSGYIVNQLSPEAYVTVNQTLFGKSGVEVQVLTNPLVACRIFLVSWIRMERLHLCPLWWPSWMDV